MRLWRRHWSVRQVEVWQREEALTASLLHFFPHKKHKKDDEM